MPDFSLAAFARLVDVNRSSVTRAVKSGRIAAVGRRITVDGASDAEVSAAAQALWKGTASPLPHHEARREQFEAARRQEWPVAASIAPPEKSGLVQSCDDITDPLRKHTCLLQKAKAEAANVELDKIAGALVERVDVDFALDDFGSTLRGLLDGLPDRLAGHLAALAGDSAAIHRELADALREIQVEISEHMMRQAMKWGGDHAA